MVDQIGQHIRGLLLGRNHLNSYPNSDLKKKDFSKKYLQSSLMFRLTLCLAIQRSSQFQT